MTAIPQPSRTSQSDNLNVDTGGFITDSNRIFSDGFGNLNVQTIQDDQQLGAAQVIATGGTIGPLTGTMRINPGAAVTAIKMPPGLRPAQECTVMNESANTATMDVVGNSLVQNGVTCVIAANGMKIFKWNSVTNTWFPNMG